MLQRGWPRRFHARRPTAEVRQQKSRPATAGVSAARDTTRGGHVVADEEAGQLEVVSLEQLNGRPEVVAADEGSGQREVVVPDEKAGRADVVAPEQLTAWPEVVGADEGSVRQ